MNFSGGISARYAAGGNERSYGFPVIAETAIMVGLCRSSVPSAAATRLSIGLLPTIGLIRSGRTGLSVVVLLSFSALALVLRLFTFGHLVRVLIR